MDEWWTAIAEWWGSLADEWSWTDPVLVLGLLTVAVTALIPLALLQFGRRQAGRDRALREQQTRSLQIQERIAQGQRRDSLSEIVDGSSDPTHIGLLWREVNEFEGADREFLLAVFRSSSTLALPGSGRGVKVDDVLDDKSVMHYLDGLERRFGSADGGHDYPGLMEFVAHATSRSVRIDSSKVVGLVTGSSARVQHPGHGFFRDLVSLLPESAAGLLNAVERINWTEGGLRLNVLTGTLLAVKDIELGRLKGNHASWGDASVALRGSVPSALASLLHRDNIRSLGRWSREGSTEPVSAMVAWLIRAVGWLADTDDHLAMRMIENLAPVITAVPAEERGWGIDARDVQQGFVWIEEKQPLLWSRHGKSLQEAATSIGPWRPDEV